MRDIWQKLISGQLDSLLQSAQDTVPGDVSAISRLRRKGTLAEVSIVLEALEARRRSRSRLRESDTWLMTVKARNRPLAPLSPSTRRED